MNRVVVGIVGGIASGKSRIAACLAGRRHAGRLDADASARRIRARPGIREEMARLFPRAVGRGGTLSRAKIAQQVFDDPKALDRLEKLLHPAIRRDLERGISRATEPLVLLDVPLLQETGLDALCDLVVYVACPARVRRARSRLARGWDEGHHAAREARQWSCLRKRARADFVVRNGTDPSETRRDCRMLLRAIDALTRKKRAGKR